MYGQPCEFMGRSAMLGKAALPVSVFSFRTRRARTGTRVDCRRHALFRIDGRARLSQRAGTNNDAGRRSRRLQAACTGAQANGRARYRFASPDWRLCRQTNPREGNRSNDARDGGSRRLDAVELAGHGGGADGRQSSPLVITWHSDVARQQRLARLYQPLERILLERCSAIVATSPAYIAGSPVLRVHACRWHLIRYGIDAGQFDDDRVGQSMAEKLRQRFGPRMILSVGRLVYYKGIKFLIQAMACGRPVVNTHIDSGVPYASLDGVSGFTVQPTSSDAMATALNRLLDNPELRMRIGRAARERAVAEFGIREMAARTLELYRSVLFTDNRNRIRGDAAPLQSDHCAANKDGHAAFRHTEAGT